MKRFMKRKWGRLPIGIIGAVMAVLLIATSVFAAYGFWSGGANVTVLESLTVQMDGTDNSWMPGTGWREVPSTTIYTITDAHPGESATIPTRITNDGYADLTAQMTYTVTGGPTNSKVTVVSGWTAGSVVLANDFEEKDIVVTVDGDAAPGNYAITINFARS